MKKNKLWMLTSCRACSRSTKRVSSLCARSIAALAVILKWREAGYHVISMKNDFKTIYGDGVVKTDFTFPTE